jgi:hypothetical protein
MEIKKLDESKFRKTFWIDYNQVVLQQSNYVEYQILLNYDGN